MKTIGLKTKPKKAKVRKPYKATIKINEVYNFIEEQGNAFLEMEDYVQPEELMKQLINVELDICLLREKTISLPTFFYSVGKTVFKIMKALGLMVKG